MGSLKVLSFIVCLSALLAATGQEQVGGLEHRNEKRIAQRPKALVRFNSWTERFATAPDADSRSQLLDEGLALAKERRAAFLELMRKDPATALSATIAANARNQLPPAITDELEVPVAGIGDLLVRCEIPPWGSLAAGMLQRQVRLNGRSYIASVYGRRVAETTKLNIPIHGVAIGEILAVHENVLAELDPAEERTATEPVIDVTRGADPSTGSGPPRLARLGGTIYRFASREHLQRSEVLLRAAEASFLSEPLLAARTLLEERPLHLVEKGTSTRSLHDSNANPQKRVLVIRTDFSDLPGDPRSYPSAEPLTAQAVQTLADNQIASYYQRSSYGKASVVFTVTPQLYRLPQTADRYATVSDVDQLHHDAVSAATADYRPSDYDTIVVLFTYLGNLPGSQIRWGGLSELGTSMVWVNGEFDFRVVAHELGHNYRLNHASFWRTGDGDPNSDKGTNLEYWDLFDTMGGNYGNDRRTDFNPWFKYQLNWISEDQVQTVTTNGTYRVYRFDDREATGTLALKISTWADQHLWVGCRRNFTENPTMQHGAYVIRGHNYPSQSELLGLGSTLNDVRDLALPVGAVFLDGKANFSITPVAEGGQAPREYLDVLVTFGPPPTISAQPQAQVTFDGQTAMFTVSSTSQGTPGFIWQRQLQGTTSWITLNEEAGFSGTRTATLLVSGATLSMDGDAFRCLLTNSAGGLNFTRPTALKVEQSGVVTLVGQPGLPGLSDGLGSFAQFNSPMGIAVDAAGNCFVADRENHVIRKITPEGLVTTWAGLGGDAGNADGNGGNARFNYPTSLAVDAAGTVYVADYGNSTIRKITSDGTVTTLFGLARAAGNSDDQGNGGRFNYPSGIAVDSLGNLYVADTGNHTIRKITPEGIESTLAELSGSSGTADGIGNSAQFDGPVGIAVDADQNVYVADQNNSTIRMITPQGQVTTLAGAPGVSGSVDGFGNDASFSHPAGLAVDAQTNLYVADRNNSTIRKITPQGRVTIVAGAAGSVGITDGTCSAARFTYPTGVAVDSRGIVYVADTSAHTIRKIRSDLTPQPTLQMSVLGKHLIFSWPTSAAGFVLETSKVPVPGASWFRVMPPAIRLGDNFVVTNSMSAPTAFFRLRKP